MRRPNVCFNLLKSRSTSKFALVEVGILRDFFTTPTRLAAGLGTKDYPLIASDDSPRVDISVGNWFPRVAANDRDGFGDQIINIEIIAVLPLYFKG